MQAVSKVRKMNCENCQIMSQSYQVLAFLGHERLSQRPCVIRFKTVVTCNKNITCGAAIERDHVT